MKKKTAVLVDLGFAVKKLKTLLGRHPIAEDIRSFAVKCLEDEEELFRIYCYHCPPCDFTIRHPITGADVDLTTRPSYMPNVELISNLKITDNVAFRSGTVAFRGWKLSKEAIRDISKTKRGLVPNDFIPDLIQKGVDMKIGLDVAWLSSKGIVDKIILITADSDFIAPMKFARREGVQIILVTLGHVSVKKELREHTDVQRDVVFP